MHSIPVARTNRLAGHLTEYVRTPLTFLHHQWKAHGDIFKFRLAHRSLIVVTHPDYIRHILQENHTNYRKSLAYRKLKLLLGNGLFTSEGSYWLQQRRLAQPAFHRERIQGYFQTMQSYTATLVEEWQTHAASSQPVPLHRSMTDITLKIIAKTLLGIDLTQEGSVVEKHLPFALQFMMKRLTSTVNFPMALPLPRHGRFRQSVGALYQFIDEIIRERRAQPTPSDDLLWMLMQSVDLDTGQGMSDQQLKDEILTFFLAGHETSAVALSWALYLLVQHPEAMAKAKAEIQMVTQGAPLRLEQLSQLSYCQQVIKEAMRMISPVWVLGREALGDDTLGKYPVKKGQSVIFSPYLVHRHPDFWDNPEAFVPERFSAESESTRHKFAYFPFGGGPRLCIGSSFALMEMQLILATLLQQFNFSLVQTAPPGYTFSLTLRPSTEIWLQVQVPR